MEKPIFVSFTNGRKQAVYINALQVTTIEPYHGDAVESDFVFSAIQDALA